MSKEILLLAYQNYNNNLISIMIKEWSLWSQFFGKILVINGPRSSGKSTLTLKLLESFSNFATVNRNLIIHEVANEIFGDFFIEATFITKQPITSFLHLNSINPESLVVGKKEEFLALQKKLNCAILQRNHQFLSSIFLKYYSEIKKIIASGTNVIIDEGLIHSNEEYDLFKKCCGDYINIKNILLFNTISETLDKCLARNSKFLELLSFHESLEKSITEALKEENSKGSSISSYRFPIKTLKSYKEFYCFNVNKIPQKIILDEISKEDMRFLLVKIHNEEIKLLQAFNKNITLIPKTYMNVEQELDKIFVNSNIVYISSKIKSDFIIRSAKIKTLNLLDDVNFLNDLLQEVICWINVNDCYNQDNAEYQLLGVESFA
ncbi:MAG: hypothetical protein H6910_06690 [Rickettsiaceae bacterium]|nr:hypothetical protein [Rickettsiaceae bacterium]